MLSAMSVAETSPQSTVLHERMNNMQISPNGATTEKNGRHFLALLDKEINHLTCLCQKAETDLRYNVMTEEVSGCIRTAIGKSQLLMTKKFKQFRKLCEDNLTPRSNEQKIMSGDLQGFWDLMSMPINDVHSMFDDVDKLRKNQWKASVLLEVQKAKEPSQSPRTKRTGNRQKKVKSNEDEEKARREVRERIAEAKKKAKERMSNEKTTNGDIAIEINVAGKENGVE